MQGVRKPTRGRMFRVRGERREREGCPGHLGYRKKGDGQVGSLMVFKTDERKVRQERRRQIRKGEGKERRI